MAAKFFDVYIRQSGARFNAAASILTSNVLDGWEKIGVAPEESIIRVDPETVPVGDGTSRCEKFKLDVETGEKEFNRYRYENIREQYHNQLCDFLFIDPEQDDFIVAVFGLKNKVYLVAESGESMTITMRAAAGKPAKTALIDNLVVSDKGTPACVVEVECWDVLGFGIADCLVELQLSSPSRTYSASSDADGFAYFLIETPIAPTTAIATAAVSSAAHAWEKNQKVTVARLGVYRLRVEGEMK